MGLGLGFPPLRGPGLLAHLPGSPTNPCPRYKGISSHLPRSPSSPVRLGSALTRPSGGSLPCGAGPPPPPRRHHRPGAGLPRWGTGRPQWSQPPTPPLHCTPWHDWVPAPLSFPLHSTLLPLPPSLAPRLLPFPSTLLLSLSPSPPLRSRGVEKRGRGAGDPSLAIELRVDSTRPGGPAVQARRGLPH